MKKLISKIAPKGIHAIKSTTNQVLEKMTLLATSAFGLVAALAWNDAIQALFKAYFPSDEKAVWMSKIWYAVIVTFFIVVITIWLGKLAEKKEPKINIVLKEKRLR